MKRGGIVNKKKPPGIPARGRLQGRSLKVGIEIKYNWNFRTSQAKNTKVFLDSKTWSLVLFQTLTNKAAFLLWMHHRVYLLPVS